MAEKPQKRRSCDTCEHHNKMENEVISQRTTIKVAAFFLGGILFSSFAFTAFVKAGFERSQDKHVETVSSVFKESKNEMKELANLVEKDHETVMKDHELLLAVVDELKETNRRLWEIRNEGP